MPLKKPVPALPGSIQLSAKRSSSALRPQRGRFTARWQIPVLQRHGPLQPIDDRRNSFMVARDGTQSAKTHHADKILWSQALADKLRDTLMLLVGIVVARAEHEQEHPTIVGIGRSSA